jgi:hypothetical protein
MPLPTKDEIYMKALELYFKDHPEATTTPEEYELKEGNYWETARRELMSGYESDLRRYLEELEEEARKVRELLGLPIPEEKVEKEIEKIEEKVERVEDEYTKWLDYFLSLTGGKCREEFQEEWVTIKDLPEEEKKKTLELLAKECLRKEVKPPPIKAKPKPMVIAPPKGREEFFERWMKIHREMFGE